MNFNSLLDIKSFRHLNYWINKHSQSKGVIRGMIQKVCDSLPVLAMKIKDMQTSKGRGDAPFSLTVIEEKLIVYKASYSPITVGSINKVTQTLEEG